MDALYPPPESYLKKKRHARQQLHRQSAETGRSASRRCSRGDHRKIPDGIHETVRQAGQTFFAGIDLWPMQMFFLEKHGFPVDSPKNRRSFQNI